MQVTLVGGAGGAVSAAARAARGHSVNATLGREPLARRLFAEVGRLLRSDELRAPGIEATQRRRAAAAATGAAAAAAARPT